MEGKKRFARGVALMLTSSFMTCLGQLLWKLSADGSFLTLVSGFALYGLGALLMLLALRCGELSVLHPMLGAGYVLSMALGHLFLDEEVTARRILGVMVILAGLVLLAHSGEERK